MKYKLQEAVYETRSGCGGAADCATKEIIANSQVQNKIANMYGGASEVGPAVPNVIGANSQQVGFFNKMAKLSVDTQENSKFDGEVVRKPQHGGIRKTKQKSKKKGGRRTKAKEMSQPRKHSHVMGYNLENAGYFNAKQGGKKRRTRKRHGKGNGSSLEKLPEAAIVQDATSNATEFNPNSSTHRIMAKNMPLKTAEVSFPEPPQIAARLGGKKKTKKFKKHYMWNTKGKRYMAKTHKQHLRGVKLGHTHKKPKKSKRRTKKRGGDPNFKINNDERIAKLNENELKELQQTRTLVNTPPPRPPRPATTQSYYEARRRPGGLNIGLGWDLEESDSD